MQSIKQLPSERKLAQFRNSLLRWYSTNARSFPWRQPSTSSYIRVVSEILLQRTRAETVRSFCQSFFARFPTWGSLSRTPKRVLQSAIQPIGLYRQRSSVLKKLSVEMVRRHGRFPSGRDEIESLPGVGQYIANAVELFLHGRPRPLLDVNMARVLERFFRPRTLVDIRYDPYLQGLAQKVTLSRQPEKLNWAILDLAALTCKKNHPDCPHCPLRGECRFRKAAAQSQ